MSILLSPEPWRSPSHPWRSGVWFCLYVTASIVGGGLLGAWLVRIGMQQESGLLSVLVDNFSGPRVMRRVQTLVAILLAPWMLKQVGWRGGNDMGWTSPQSRRKRKQDFLWGLGLGALLTGVLFAVAIGSGVRAWREFSLASWLLMVLKDIMITAIGVGLIEETFARGVLYRSMARTWTPWIGALVSSLLFGYVHFLKVRPGRFEEGGIPALQSALFETLQMDHAPLKLLNMVLFGLVLCRMVHFRSDIWMVAGFHAAAVGIIKISTRQTEVVAPAVRNLWIGNSSAFDEGWLMTVMLLFLLVLMETVRFPSGASSRVRF